MICRRELNGVDLKISGSTLYVEFRQTSPFSLKVSWSIIPWWTLYPEITVPLKFRVHDHHHLSPAGGGVVLIRGGGLIIRVYINLLPNIPRRYLPTCKAALLPTHIFTSIKHQINDTPQFRIHTAHCACCWLERSEYCCRVIQVLCSDCTHES